MEYNQIRLHSSLDNLIPVEYALKLSCNYEHSPYRMQNMGGQTLFRRDLYFRLLYYYDTKMIEKALIYEYHEVNLIGEFPKNEYMGLVP